MDNRFEELNSRYNTLVIVMVGSWVTIMAAIIAAFITLYFK